MLDHEIIFNLCKENIPKLQSVIEVMLENEEST